MKKCIAGLKITTTNENNKAEFDIGDAWTIFFTKKYEEKLKNDAINKNLYAVYTNYSGNFQEGEYDFYLGVEVSEKPENFDAITVELDKYKIYEFHYSEPKDTIEAWKTIWNDNELKRRYTADIEEYDFEKGLGKIYISIE